MTATEVGTRAEVIEAFTDLQGRKVRLLGHGTAQDRLPPAPDGAREFRLGGLDAIERLEPDDLTCSVEPGVTRSELDHALAEAGVWLPCKGSVTTGGSVGGDFAADLDGPLAPGAPSPRTLLLGVEGVLAEGKAFKGGARVVKSVAGFDLQKLFVGSRGRLFAATLLHLKLRPRPPAMQAFRDVDLERDRALSLFGALRRLSPPPQELWLGRQGDAWDVCGLLIGNARHCASVVARLEVAPCERVEIPPLEPGGAEREVVQGNVRPSRLPELIDALPPAAALRVNGVGQFQVAMSAPETDALFRRAAETPFCAEVRAGPAGRRGILTARDPGGSRLEGAIKQALDPQGMLV